MFKGEKNGENRMWRTLCGEAYGRGRAEEQKRGEESRGVTREKKQKDTQLDEQIEQQAKGNNVVRTKYHYDGDASLPNLDD